MNPEKIRQRLKASGMTQVELARKIGLSETAMSKIMNGARMVKADEADAIRAALGDEPAVNISPLERRLIDAIRALSATEQDLALKMLEAWSTHESS